MLSFNQSSPLYKPYVSLIMPRKWKSRLGRISYQMIVKPRELQKGWKPKINWESTDKDSAVSLALGSSPAHSSNSSQWVSFKQEQSTLVFPYHPVRFKNPSPLIWVKLIFQQFPQNSPLPISTTSCNYPQLIFPCIQLFLDFKSFMLQVMIKCKYTFKCESWLGGLG